MGSDFSDCGVGIVGNGAIMKVYVVTWCQYDWNAVISVHETKIGAYKALQEHRYNIWVEWREENLQKCRGYGKELREETREFGLGTWHSPIDFTQGKIIEFEIKE